jgi:hypothetical protein
MTITSSQGPQTVDGLTMLRESLKGLPERW